MSAETSFIITTDKNGKIDKVREVEVVDRLIYSPLSPSTTFSIPASAMAAMTSAIRLAEEARKRATSNYTKHFYDRYRGHLTEPHVRYTHDAMFKILDSLHPALGHMKVIDFGCGTGEFDKYHKEHSFYTGIDSSPDAGSDLRIWSGGSGLITADFLEDGWQKQIDFNPTVFVGLFSTEIVMPPEQRYKFYKKVFLDFPSIKLGMVSGFYYDSKKHDSVIEEKSDAGIFTVYQTVESQGAFQNNIFDELRCYRNVPSELWGEDLVEVWKFFIKK